MSDDTRSCPSCGAEVPASTDRCDLCGTVLEDPDSEVQETAPGAQASEEGGEENRDAPSDSGSSGDEGEEEASVFCNECGWENPLGAQYCSRCGGALQDLSAADVPEGTRPIAADLPTGPADGSNDAATDADGSVPPEETQGAMGRQIMLLVGGALLLVVGLFFVTQWSAQQDWGGDGSTDAPAASAETGPAGSGPASGASQMPSGGSGGGGELTDLETLLDQTGTSSPGAMAEQIDSMEARIEQASGPEKREAQAEFVNLLIGAGQPGRAAVVQSEIADATDAVDAQRRAADLLYRWMQKLQGEGQREQVLEVARHAARAYESVANERPDDLDARTRMGEAYLLTNRPMRGIKEINAVLDDDSTFVPARFQKGLALLQINRLDQAIRQFERVKQFADEESPFVRQADRALKVIEKQRQQSSSGSSGSAGGPGDGDTP